MHSVPSKQWPFVGSMDQESSQQLRTWFSEHFLLHNLLRSIVSVTAQRIWHERCSKTTFDSTSEMIELYSNRKQEEQYKTFERVSMEPTTDCNDKQK